MSSPMEQPVPQNGAALNSAAGMLLGLAQQQRQLLWRIEALEETVSAVVSSGSDSFGTVSIKSLQHLDFMRQSIIDIARIMTIMHENAVWGEAGEPDLDRLCNAVDMQGSLEGVVIKPASSSEESPSSNTPTTDLWV